MQKSKILFVLCSHLILFGAILHGMRQPHRSIVFQRSLKHGFFFAIEQNRPGTVQGYLLDGMPVDVRSDDDYETALLHAARSAAVDVANILIAAKATLDIQDEAGRTALMIVADSEAEHYQGPLFKTAQLLINAHTNLHILDENGNNALILATKQLNHDVMQLLIGALHDDLLERQALTYENWFDAPLEICTIILAPFMRSIDDEDANGRSALYWAVHMRDLEGIEILLEGKADINSNADRPIRGSVLWCAILNHGWEAEENQANIDIIKYLIQQGADPRLHGIMDLDIIKQHPFLGIFPSYQMMVRTALEEAGVRHKS